MVDTVVVDRWLEEVGVGFKPTELCGWLDESDIFQHYACTRGGGWRKDVGSGMRLEWEIPFWDIEGRC